VPLDTPVTGAIQNDLNLMHRIQVPSHSGALASMNALFGDVPGDHCKCTAGPTNLGPLRQNKRRNPGPVTRIPLHPGGYSCTVAFRGVGSKHGLVGPIGT
jgi:hypothetical protein